MKINICKTLSSKSHDGSGSRGVAAEEWNASETGRPPRRWSDEIIAGSIAGSSDIAATLGGGFHPAVDWPKAGDDHGDEPETKYRSINLARS